ncbi:MAG: hypothetical protein ACPHL6_12435 [Rubripirellula sp.]
MSGQFASGCLIRIRSANPLIYSIKSDPESGDQVMPKRQRGNQLRYLSPSAEHGIPFEWDEIADHEICRWVEERKKEKPFGLIMRQ